MHSHFPHDFYANKACPCNSAKNMVLPQTSMGEIVNSGVKFLNVWPIKNFTTFA